MDSFPKNKAIPKAARSRSHSVAHSAQSEDVTHTPQPYHVSPPGTRGRSRPVRDASVFSETRSQNSEASFLSLSYNTAQAPAQLPEHYHYTPTVPSPFQGSLEASLDAVLVWGAMYANTRPVVDTLLQAVDSTTNWPNLLSAMMIDGDKPAGRGRWLLEELLFFVTRTLLPEQITENRLALGRLFERKRQLAIRVILRYDGVHDWRKPGALTAPSLPPKEYEEGEPPDTIPGLNKAMFPNRRELMPNIMSTLIAAPIDGWSTFGVRERMKHHVSHLDDYLVLDDADVAKWDEAMLLAKTSQILLHWQWIRRDTEMLLDLEVDAWEAFEGKAEDCEWIADNPKRLPSNKNEKGGGNTKAKGTRR